MDGVLVLLAKRNKTLESRMPVNGHVRFGGGPTEKGRFDRYLAGGLPYFGCQKSVESGQGVT
jgi:hypothetical protein